jgi:putative methyltransferase (TIGR04325 family)
VSTARDFDVWEGVYATFQEAPKRGLGFDDELWRSRSSAAAREAHARFVEGRELDYSMGQRNSVLATLAGATLARQPRLRVLDFGGGPGFGFLVLQAAIPDAARRVDYSVVEVEGVCREGAALFEGRPAPTFHTSIPTSGEFDVVFTASTLQYVDDWRALCRRLAAFRARYLVFSDVFAGPFTSYVTLQHYYDSTIPHWLLNEEEFVSEITAAGYSLQLRRPCNVQVLGAYGALPMENLPSERRLTNASHFMFSLVER